MKHAQFSDFSLFPMSKKRTIIKPLKTKGENALVFRPRKHCVKDLAELSHGKAFPLGNHRMKGTFQKNPYAPPGGQRRAATTDRRYPPTGMKDAAVTTKACAVSPCSMLRKPCER
jgi:hypothetical protein